jgi:hypothetical protein
MRQKHACVTIGFLSATMSSIPSSTGSKTSLGLDQSVVQKANGIVAMQLHYTKSRRPATVTSASGDIAA